MDVRQLAHDLVAEQDALEAVVAPLAPPDWARPTPSPGWTIADQVGHLTYFDAAAGRAIRTPDSFSAEVSDLWERAAAGASLDDLTLVQFRAMEPAELFGAWRAARADLADAARTLQDDTRVPWYGPAMGAKSFLTARLMEVWAHGQDIVDAVGASRPATDRLRHIAQLGVITRGWAYANRGRDVPEVDVRVELTAPSGGLWAWGAEDAADMVGGPAEDFCLVVTQRRNVADTALVVRGAAASEWMAIAQAFAGPPTDPPSPGGV